VTFAEGREGVGPVTEAEGAALVHVDEESARDRAGLEGGGMFEPLELLLRSEEVAAAADEFDSAAEEGTMVPDVEVERGLSGVESVGSSAGSVDCRKSCEGDLRTSFVSVAACRAVRGRRDGIAPSDVARSTVGSFFEVALVWLSGSEKVSDAAAAAEGGEDCKRSIPSTPLVLRFFLAEGDLPVFPKKLRVSTLCTSLPFSSSLLCVFLLSLSLCLYHTLSLSFSHSLFLSLSLSLSLTGIENELAVRGSESETRKSRQRRSIRWPLVIG
jgi:hypothetical protein